MTINVNNHKTIDCRRKQKSENTNREYHEESAGGQLYAGGSVRWDPESPLETQNIPILHFSGQYHSLENLSPAQVEKLFQREIFTLTGDREAGAGGSFEAGTGVYINNYDNFLLWVNKDDHLKLVSAARGQDIKYVLIRLHKVITKIEETLKVKK